MATLLGHVRELWRYPVKSMGGEQVDQLEVDRRGAVGDRWWALRNAEGKVASGKTTTRFARVPNLLTMSAFTDDDGVVWARSADGRCFAVNDHAAALLASEVAGEPLTLAPESDVSHFDDMPVHILSSASLQWLALAQPDAEITSRRARPNVVVDLVSAGDNGTLDEPRLPEEAWCGAELCIGGAVRLRVDRPTLRCVMTTMAQPGLDFVPGILKTIERLNGSRWGVYAEVLQSGALRLGDEVWLEP